MIRSHYSWRSQLGFLSLPPSNETMMRVFLWCRNCFPLDNSWTVNTNPANGCQIGESWASKSINPEASGNVGHPNMTLLLDDTVIAWARMRISITIRNSLYHFFTCRFQGKLIDFDPRRSNTIPHHFSMQLRFQAKLPRSLEVQAFSESIERICLSCNEW